MAEASIPVDLLNPGQVFACLGFLEAAETLLGNARGAFDWSDEADVRFRLQADSKGNPIEVVLKALTQADIIEVEPINWPGIHECDAIISEIFPCHLIEHNVD